jgi:two-component system sensor histidine kinase DesK
MRISELIKAIHDPPPESLVGHMTRFEGRFMRKMPFFILINLAWLFLWPVIEGRPFLTVILPILLSVPLFVYLHFCAYFYGGPASGRMRYVFGQYLLGYIVGYFYLTSLAYLIFAFYVTAFSMTLRRASYVIFGSVALFALEIVLLGLNWQILASLMLPAVVLAISAVYTAYNSHQQAALRRSEQEVSRLAKLAERERIGRDLHDLLGHTLSVVALKSELARKLIDHDIDAARREIAEVERVARDSLQQVRTAVSGIRSTELAAEIAAATALLEAQGVKVRCETENVKLPHDRETALALSLREAATNVRRHSGARGVTIRVKKEASEVVVEVVDDGRGGRIVPGNGLNGMRERLGSVGGSLTLVPGKEGGTMLRAAVPLAA